MDTQILEISHRCLYFFSSEKYLTTILPRRAERYDLLKAGLVWINAFLRVPLVKARIDRGERPSRRDGDDGDGDVFNRQTN